jgi:hypothetical protein
VLLEHVDFSKLVPIESFTGDDPKEAREIRALFMEAAAAYLKGFPWVRALEEGYVGDLCYPGIVCVFLFRIKPDGDDVPEWLWVVEGDRHPPMW